MSSHNNIHMRSVPYQSHMHIDTSSIKIIQSIKHIRCHHAMSSHNNIHMCSVPYKSHMHIDTSSIKIIQSYAMHAHAHAHAHHLVPFPLGG
jgi:hypothetical protein